MKYSYNIFVTKLFKFSYYYLFFRYFSIHIIKGCWNVAEKKGPCLQQQCVSTSTAGTHMYFCCCYGDLCNKNVTINESIIEVCSICKILFYFILKFLFYLQAMKSDLSSETEIPELKNSKSFWISPILIICTPIGLIVIATVIFLFSCKKPIKPGPETAPLAPSGPGYSSNLQNVDNLKVCSMIGQGKYGTVWKGMINEQTVAVKIFPAQHKQYFINERNIYSLQLMDNPSLLSYFGKLQINY